MTLLTLISCGSFEKKKTFRKLSSLDQSFNTDLDVIKGIVEQSLDVFLHEEKVDREAKGISRVEVDIKDVTELNIYLPLNKMSHFEGKNNKRKQRLSLLINELYSANLKKHKNDKGFNPSKVIKINYLETTEE